MAFRMRCRVSALCNFEHLIAAELGRLGFVDAGVRNPLANPFREEEAIDGAAHITVSLLICSRTYPC
jgi:hypothetical protein